MNRLRQQTVPIVDTTGQPEKKMNKIYFDISGNQKIQIHFPLFWGFFFSIRFKPHQVQIELLYMLISLDKLTEEIDLIF